MSANAEHPPGSVVPVPDLLVSARKRQFVLVVSGLLFAIGTLGSNIGPAWVDERPAVVLALSARNRNLLGSVPYIDAVPYALLGFGRLLVAGVALYFLGKWYGEKAITWTEGQVGELPAIYRWFQSSVDKAGWALLLVMPASNLVCLMAGYRRMRVRTFVIAICVGIALKLVVLWIGGKLFEDLIVSVLDWVDKYQWWIVAGLFALTFLQSARKVRTTVPEVLDEIETPDGVIEPHVPHTRHLLHHTDGQEHSNAEPDKG